jgi:hypothetical protein
LGDIFIVSSLIPDFGRLFSLLTEAAQMTQNKKEKQTLSVRGGIKFIWISPLRQCKPQQRIFRQQGKIMFTHVKSKLYLGNIGRNFFN